MESIGKYKFAAVINKNLEPGVAMNALAHMSAAIVASADEGLKEKMAFIDYIDGDRNRHKSISGLSLIVLRGKALEIKKLRETAVNGKIHFVDFIETMTGDTYKEQLERTANTPYEAVNFYGIMMFGEKEVLEPMTKRLSLWR